MLITNLVRTFAFTSQGEPVTLADPMSSMTPKDVLSFYANTYPELITATIIGPIVDGDCEVYTFQSVMGTKG